MTYSVRVLGFALLAAFAAAQAGKSAPPAPAAQTPTTIPAPVVPPPINSDPTKEAAIFERIVTKVSYEDDGTGIRESSVAIRVQSQAGVQQLAVLSFPYTSFNEGVELDYVRVRKPGGTVIATPDYNIQDMPADVTRNAPMYSDIHEKHVTVKGLGIGDLLEYVVRYRILKPEVPGHFWYQQTFTKLYISKDEELEISIPAGKYVNVASPDLQPKIQDEGKRRVYSWKTSNVDLKERQALLKKAEAPKPSVQITTFRSWEEVGRWYKELQQPELEVTPQIQAKAAELTKGLATDDDKIRAVYNFVSTRFHYVSLSFGIGRYRPHAAEDVLENEYGDCKDKHTLLAALLKAAGYEVWPALINATSKIDPSVPSPAQFNHAISVVPRAGKLIWLDTTPEVSPFGLLLVNLRDKQALVMPDDKPASLMTTPAEPPFRSLQTFTAEGKLSAEGTLSVHVEQRLRGDGEVMYRAAFRSVPPAQWQELGQRISSFSGFGGEVSNVTASPPEEVDKPFVVSWDYTRKTYGDWANHQIVAPVPWFGIEGSANEDKKPEEPVRLGAQGELTYKAKVTLPAGLAPAYSAKEDLNEAFADYHASYAIEGGVLVVTRQLTIKKDDVSPDSWEVYKKFCKALADERDRYIDLATGKTVYPSGEGPAQSEAASAASTPQPTPEITRLMQEGAQASQNRDLTRAQENYMRVIQIDPKYPGVHAALGWVYCAENNSEACKREWRLEEEYQPNNLSVYMMFGKMLEFLRHNDDEALAQYQMLLARDPGNRDAALAAAKIYLREKKAVEAVNVLEKAAEISPDSSTVQYALGSAYLRSNQPEKGITVLKKAVALDGSPDGLNSAAYALAVANVGLDLAQEFAGKAVHQLETDSLNAGDDAAGLANTRKLAAAWDTLGWVFFREAKYDKARPYLETAWDLSQSSVIGDHVAQLYERQGNKEKAAHQYKLALAAALSPGEDKADIKDHLKHLTGQDPDNSGVHLQRRQSVTLSPGEELSRMRNTRLAEGSHESGSAVFTIIFEPGKIDAVKYVSGEKSLEPWATKISAPKFSFEFPDQSPAKVIRRGILTCGVAGCDFTYLLSDSSVNISLNANQN